MTGILIKIVLFAFVGGAIAVGLRRIFADVKNQFAADDEAKRQRDLKERKRGDVVDLKRDEDGVFRPGDDEKK